jgi:hypothetical protein
MRCKNAKRSRCALEALEDRQLLSAVIANASENDVVYDSTNHKTWVADYDLAAKALKVQSRVDGGVWSAPTTVDEPGKTGQIASNEVGHYPSISISNNGTVGVAYYDATNADLKLVEANSATGVWQDPQTVESKNVTGLYPSLVYNSNARPIITFFKDASTTDYLRIAIYDGSIWTADVVDSGLGVGRYSSAGIRPNVGWAVSYVTNIDFKYAEQNGSGKTVYDPVDSGTGGSYTSLAFDNSGVPWFSYYYSNDVTSTHKVRVAKRNGSTWDRAAVFNGRGYNTNLWKQASGDMQLAFYDDASNNGGNNARVFNCTSGTWQLATDPSTYLFKGGGSGISAVAGAGGAITFTSGVNIQTGSNPATYANSLQLRDASDAVMGQNWPKVTQSVTSPVPNGSNPGVVFNGSLWLVGTNGSGATRDDVWNSTDNGVTWTNVTAGLSNGAAFGMRFEHQLTVFNGELWVTGGYNGSTYFSDAWHSSDGVTWTQASTGGYTGREMHAAVVNNGRLYVIGGENRLNGLLNDVWSTADGVTWQEETANAFFSPRCAVSAVSYNGRIFVIGGYTGGLSPVSNQVLSSADGANWIQVNGANSTAPLREGGTSLVFDNRIWYLGGRDYGLNQSNIVYYSIDGLNWAQAGTLPEVRSEAAGMVFNDKMWLIGGSVPGQAWSPDVLYSNP